MQRKTHFHKYPISSNSQKEDGLKLWAEFTKYVRIHTTNRVTSCFCCHTIFPDSPLILSQSIRLSQTVHFREVLCRLINYYAMGVVCGPRLASSTEEELFILLSCLCGVYCLSLCHLMHMKIVALF